MIEIYGDFEKGSPMDIAFTIFKATFYISYLAVIISAMSLFFGTEWGIVALLVSALVMLMSIIAEIYICSVSTEEKFFDDEEF